MAPGIIGPQSTAAASSYLETYYGTNTRTFNHIMGEGEAGGGGFSNRKMGCCLTLMCPRRWSNRRSCSGSRFVGVMPPHFPKGLRRVGCTVRMPRAKGGIFACQLVPAAVLLAYPRRWCKRRSCSGSPFVGVGAFKPSQRIKPGEAGDGCSWVCGAMP